MENTDKKKGCRFLIGVIPSFVILDEIIYPRTGRCQRKGLDPFDPVTMVMTRLITVRTAQGQES